MAQNQEAIVQLTLVTETYLEAKNKKRLMEAHPNLMPIIPEIKAKKGSDNLSNKTIQSLDGQSIEELFVNYFQHKKGQTPNSNLLAVLREVLATDTE